MNQISESSNKREYYFENETGDAHIVVYNILPGVEVAFSSVHMDQFDFRETEPHYRDHYVGFYYCKEGRIEQEEDNEFFYLMPGDCSVILRDRPVKEFKLPTKHYHGISIGIDADVSFAQFDAFLQDECIDPLEIAASICGEGQSAILRASDAMERVFSHLYTMKEDLRPNYLKIKLLELLYLLKHVDRKSGSAAQTLVPRLQVEFVQRVADYITKNINDKITVKRLTTEFGVSDTYLQSSFRSVYGMPVISFIRAQKMQSAAQVLIHTTRSVDDIAEEYGYENESKFSAAFKKIMGDTPSVYRREHSKVKVL